MHGVQIRSAAVMGNPTHLVIPAKAGIQLLLFAKIKMDSGFRRNDEVWGPASNPQSIVIPASRFNASAYFAAVPSMTSCGRRGPGAVLFQSSVSR
jgi:hypothetical protein